ncbi:hypothetical protein MC7420_4058 [Coleofasciculus chthonoplastes PCC 7420]|uniref:Uncharacterized protein n=1 Tax=Coleofasciculus chthonoplastes PCC 7420 TaxID=118168 RepID=B4VV55_9CYAN|nr:hypothetical protein MC7420_4058 [Coleofasciculus chthonoplastes PCC 7420]
MQLDLQFSPQQFITLSFRPVSGGTLCAMAHKIAIDQNRTFA